MRHTWSQLRLLSSATRLTVISRQSCPIRSSNRCVNRADLASIVRVSRFTALQSGQATRRYSNSRYMRVAPASKSRTTWVLRSRKPDTVRPHPEQTVFFGAVQASQCVRQDPSDEALAWHGHENPESYKCLVVFLLFPLSYCIRVQETCQFSKNIYKAFTGCYLCFAVQQSQFIQLN